jgi:hypothetical protein
MRWAILEEGARRREKENKEKEIEKRRKRRETADSTKTQRLRGTLSKCGEVDRRMWLRKTIPVADTRRERETRDRGEKEGLGGKN